MSDTHTTKPYLWEVGAQFPRAAVVLHTAAVVAVQSHVQRQSVVRVGQVRVGVHHRLTLGDGAGGVALRMQTGSAEAGEEDGSELRAKVMNGARCTDRMQR